MKTFILLTLLVSAQAGEIAEIFAKDEKARREQYPDRRAYHRAFFQTENPPSHSATNRSRVDSIHTSTNHNVTEIGIERTSCYGTCPEYTFIIKSDGSCRYDGGDYAKLKGKRTGVIQTHQFHSLANLFVDASFKDLRFHYSQGGTDQPTTFTTAIINGSRKTIQNYGNAASGRLWAIEELLDLTLQTAKWDKKSLNPFSPKNPR